MLLALLAACGGAGSPTTTVASTTTTTREVSPTFVTVTTTSTTAPRTTVLPPPVIVGGWEDKGIRTVRVDLVFEYPQWEIDLRTAAESALRSMGLEVAGDPDAVLAFALEGTSESASYSDLGRCHTGARLDGTATLSADGEEDLEVSLEGRVSTPFLIYANECGENPEDAPFDVAFAVPLVEAMTGLFGESSIPYLVEVMFFLGSGETGTVLAPLRAALSAFEAMDRETMSPELEYRFLGAVIDSMHFVLPDPTGFLDPSSREYRNEMRSLLLEYSDEDFGFADNADVEEWRAWLEEWREAAGVAP